MKLTDISPAIALTPLDGRYHQQTAPLVEYLSEPALNRERMRVEVEWMILLANGFEGNGNQTIVPGVKPLTDEEQAFLRAIPEEFGAEGIAQHAAHEAKTHHDVKAVEYYIDDQLDKAADVLGHDTQLTGLKTLVHFACTSEDINNLSIARCVKNGIENVWLPGAQAIVDHLAQKAEEYRDKAMLSLTHGQPATPTTLGKELAVYVYRLNRQLNKVRAQEYLGKINGATGTFGAHLAACPDVDWVAVSREFVTNRMGLTWNPLTTQIESHDWQADHHRHRLHQVGDEEGAVEDLQADRADLARQRDGDVLGAEALAQRLCHRRRSGAGREQQRSVVHPVVTGEGDVVTALDQRGAVLAGVVAPHPGDAEGLHAAAQRQLEAAAA